MVTRQNSPSRGALLSIAARPPVPHPHAGTEVTVEPTFKAVGVGSTGLTTACKVLAGVPPPLRQGSRVTVGDASNGQAKMSMGGVPPRGIDGSPEVALGPPFLLHHCHQIRVHLPRFQNRMKAPCGAGSGLPVSHGSWPRPAGELGH